MGLAPWEALDGASDAAAPMVHGAPLDFHEPVAHHVHACLQFDAHDFLAWRPASFLDTGTVGNGSTIDKRHSRDQVLLEDMNFMVGFKPVSFSDSDATGSSLITRRGHSKNQVFSEDMIFMVGSSAVRRRQALHSAFLSPTTSMGEARIPGATVTSARIRTAFDAEGEAMSAADAAAQAEKNASKAEKEAEDAEAFEEDILALLMCTLAFGLFMGISTVRMYNKWLDMKRRYRDYVLARRAEGQLQ